MKAMKDSSSLQDLQYSESHYLNDRPRVSSSQTPINVVDTQSDIALDEESEWQYFSVSRWLQSIWKTGKIFDYGLIACIGIVGGVLELVEPVNRLVYVERDIFFPYAKSETVSTAMLMIISFFIPLGLMSIWYLVDSFVFGYSKKSNFKIYHNAILSLTLGMALNIFLTTFIKIRAGRLRPDFLYRCNPDPTTFKIGDLVDVSTQCTGDPSLLRQGRKSFPSGHASNSSCGMTVLAFFLMIIFRKWSCNSFNQSNASVRTIMKPRLWRWAIGVLIPVVTALFVSLSRVSDYRHHWQDVLAGIIIGISVGTFSVWIYFSNWNNARPWKVATTAAQPSYDLEAYKS